MKFEREFAALVTVSFVSGAAFCGLLPMQAANATSTSLRNLLPITDHLLSVPPPFTVTDPKNPGTPKNVALWGPRRNLGAVGDGTNGMTFGGAELADLIAEDGSIRGAPISSDFTFDPVGIVDWYRFSSDYSFEFESDELLDFRAIAIASYLPEIRYWLEGSRWSDFNSTIPVFTVDLKTGETGNTVEANENATQRPFAPLVASNGRNGHGSGNSDQDKAASTRALSVTEFLLGMLFKMVKLPITYVILAVCLGVFLINVYRQPRT